MDYLHHFRYNCNKSMNSVLVSWRNTSSRISSDVQAQNHEIPRIVLLILYRIMIVELTKAIF